MARAGKAGAYFDCRSSKKFLCQDSLEDCRVNIDPQRGRSIRSVVLYVEVKIVCLQPALLLQLGLFRTFGDPIGIDDLFDNYTTFLLMA